MICCRSLRACHWCCGSACSLCRPCYFARFTHTINTQRMIDSQIIAEYLGGAVTCDAHHMTDPRADGLGVSTCIELALKDSGIDRDQVNYINAHATR